MLDMSEPTTKPCTTFAHMCSTEELQFYGELGEKYMTLFKRDKEDILSIDLSPALSFLAKHGFSAVANDFFQKVDIITL